MTRILNFDHKYSLRRIVIVCVRTCACKQVCTYVCVYVCMFLLVGPFISQTAICSSVCLSVSLRLSPLPPFSLSLFIVHFDFLILKGTVLSG